MSKIVHVIAALALAAAAPASADDKPAAPPAPAPVKPSPGTLAAEPGKLEIDRLELTGTGKLELAAGGRMVKSPGGELTVRPVDPGRYLDVAVEITVKPGPLVVRTPIGAVTVDILAAAGGAYEVRVTPDFAHTILARPTVKPGDWLDPTLKPQKAGVASPARAWRSAADAKEPGKLSFRFVREVPTAIWVTAGATTWEITAPAPADAKAAKELSAKLNLAAMTLKFNQAFMAGPVALAGMNPHPKGTR